MLTPATIVSHPPATPGIRWAWRDLRPGHAETSVRAWLRDTLADDSAAAATTLLREPGGRPYLDPPSAALDISWSHSGQGLLIALGRGVRLGIDLERLRPRPRALQLAQRFFTADEADWLAGHDDRQRMPAFLRLWCAKEAVLKAHGRGLSFGLHKLAFADDNDGALKLVACDPALGRPDDWQLREWRPRPDYHAALAWRASTPDNDPAQAPADSGTISPP